MFESDAVRLELIQTAGEPFDTGKPTRLWAIFKNPSFDSFGQPIPVKNRKPSIECLESDIAAHELVKQSVITRDADGARYSVRDFDSDGTGMVEITLGA